MKILRLVPLLIIAVAPSVVADEAFHTGPYLNGRAWKAMGGDGKAMYVTAVYNALMFADGFHRDTVLKDTFLASVPAGETVQGVDAFYKDPANASVIILAAMRIFKLQVEGHPQAEIQEAIEAVRRASAK